jgi:hypothetical protein
LALTRKINSEHNRIGDGPMFLNPATGETVREFRAEWAAALAATGLDKSDPVPIFHDFRRCGARNLMFAGLPIKVAMAVTGHKSHEMFLRYGVIDNKDVKNSMPHWLSSRKMRNARPTRRWPTWRRSPRALDAMKVDGVEEVYDRSGPGECRWVLQEPKNRLNPC